LIDYPCDVYELVLAHKLPDEVEAAYLRGAYLEKCKGLRLIGQSLHRTIVQ